MKKIEDFSSQSQTLIEQLGEMLRATVNP